MKKKTTEISVSTSSGAEKVERIEREEANGQKKQVKSSVKKTQKDKTAIGEAAMGNPSAEEIKRVNATDGSAEKESRAAKERVEIALKKKEEQEKRKASKAEKKAKKAELRKKRAAEKKAKIEKRAAEKKARAEKHAAERKALAEKRKAEKEEKIRARAHAKAHKNNENYKKKKAKSTRQKEHTARERNKGYGGWIAAVVSLGVVTLALATTVTVGAVEMSKADQAQMGAYRGTMYELTGIMENVDGDLDRVRISNTPSQQSRILTDLLVQARLAELDLEKMPITAEADRNVTAFINRTAAECERMLGKLRRGEGLDKQDKESLEALYQINHGVRQQLNEFVAGMTDKDIAEFTKKGEGKMRDALDQIEKSTIMENTVGNMGEASPRKEHPAEIEKGDMPHIEAATAEELCAKYFSEYQIADFQCIGETVTNGYQAYNVQGYDDRGNQLFAELSQTDGKLLRFDYYEDCTESKLDVRSAEYIAEEFLELLGYDDMEVVRLRNNGSTTDFTFVYEDDDVLFYPDEIRIKVCRTRGVVSGFDCTKYLQNHKRREGESVRVNITLGQAYDKLYDGLQVDSSRLVVIKTERGEEKSAYEFLCSYEEEKYFVFIDAVTGEEISIVNAKVVA